MVNETLQNKDSTEDKKTTKQRQIRSWQLRLLPWMVGVPTVLIIIFIILATIQFNRFNTEISTYKNSELNDVLPSPKDTSGNYLITGNPEYVKLFTLAKMEEESMNRRYSQGGVLLSARLYTQWLGFVTGMILAIVGSVFIISKLNEKTSKLDMSYNEQVRLQLTSSSPGVIFGVLGTCLMLATIFTHNNIDVKDMPLYLNYPAMQELHARQPSGNEGGKIKSQSEGKNDSIPIH